MAAPVLAELNREYPHLEVVLLTKSFFSPFFDGIPRLTLYPMTGEHRGLKGLWRLFRQLRRDHPDITVVVDLHQKLYSAVLRLFYRFCGIPAFKIDKGRPEKRALTRKYDKIRQSLEATVERYADVFRKAGFDLPTIKDSLTFYRSTRPVPAALGTAKEAGSQWLGIAPFAQHSGKIYPLEMMEQVISLLLERYPSLRIFLFGGGATEKRKAQIWQDKWPEQVISVIGKFDLRQELDLMGNLDGMVSMDSSSMHMASLVGLPVVSVWGATHPDAGFLGLGQAREDAVGVDPAELTCRPCSVYGNKPCWHKPESDLYYACLNHLPPERIVERVTVHLGQ